MNLSEKIEHYQMKISLKLFLTMFILWCKVEDFIAFADGKVKVNIGPTGSVFSLFIESMFCLWLWDHCAVIRIFCCSCNMVCWFMVYITDTFNNISIIVAVSFIDGGNRLPGENHRPVASHWRTLSHNVVSSIHGHERGSSCSISIAK